MKADRQTGKAARQNGGGGGQGVTYLERSEVRAMMMGGSTTDDLFYSALIMRARAPW